MRGLHRAYARQTLCSTSTNQRPRFTRTQPVGPEKRFRVLTHHTGEQNTEQKHKPLQTGASSTVVIHSGSIGIKLPLSSQRPATEKPAFRTVQAVHGQSFPDVLETKRMQRDSETREEINIASVDESVGPPPDTSELGIFLERRAGEHKLVRQ